MSVRIKRRGLSIALATKLTSDLVLNNLTNKSTLAFFKKTDEYIYIPLYYARILFSNPNLSYKTLSPPSSLDMSVNHRDTQPIIDFDIDITPYPAQLELIDEAKREIENKGSILINAYTSFGKSVVLLHMIKHTRRVTLILLTRDTFLTQIALIMKMRSNAVLWIPGKKTKTSLSCVSMKPPDNVQVIICMMGRIHYIPENILESVGTLVIDEAHLACTPTCVNSILSNRPKYIILLTATPQRDDGMHDMLNLLSGPLHIIRTMEKPVTVIRWGTKINIPIQVGSNGKVDWAFHNDYISSCKQRNLLIKEFVYNLIDPSRNTSKIHKLVANHSKELKHKILGMTWIAEKHRESIMKEFNDDKKISVDYLDAYKKTYKDCDFLLGTFGKVGVGFDQALFCEDFDGVRIDVAMMLASTKSYNILKQARGRACRSEYPIFVYMVDDNPISEKHWKICRKFLLEEPGTTIVNYGGE